MPEVPEIVIPISDGLDFWNYPDWTEDSRDNPRDPNFSPFWMRDPKLPGKPKAAIAKDPFDPFIRCENCLGQFLVDYYADKPGPQACTKCGKIFS